MTLSGNNRKTFVLGLDGATWDLLNPLMEQGTMPNLRAVVENGASGVLRSTTPPYTAPAWVSCVTGVNPGKHGVFGFITKDGARREKTFIGSTDVQVPKLWQYVNGAGKKAGMINIPVTYPVEPVDGFAVADFLTPLGKDDYAYPPSIYRDYLKPIEYVINVRIARIQDFTGDAFPQVMEDLKRCTEKREQAMRALVRDFKPDFFMIVFTVLDKIQHKFWKYLDHREPMYHTPFARAVRPHLISLYRQIDEVLGRVLEGIGSDATLYIVSDHGFGPMNKSFFINKWLKEEGYLKIRQGRLLVHRLLRKYLKTHAFGSRNIDVFHNPVYSYIDMEKSLFLGSDPYEQGIYCASGSRSNGYREQVEVLKNKLLGLRDEASGEHLFDRVYGREELFSGASLDKAPDIILQMKDYGYSFASGYPLRGGYLFPVESPQGCHYPSGIFAACGADIVPCRNIDASIMDIAPTVLSNMGLPLSKEMDGRVLTEIFSPRFLQASEIRHADEVRLPERAAVRSSVYSAHEKEDVAGRLRDLGYMD